MKVVFMGTPDFAVPTLQRLLDDHHQVLAVYTQPDKPVGRGYQLREPPVKALAKAHDIPVYQPKTLRDGQAAEEIAALAPDAVVVVAYGKILPREILDIPKYGCINLHASLLPKYRGAGPIQWSVIRGEQVTGVTSMYMGEGLDTGDVILRQETPIGPEETASELHDRLSVMGAQCISETLSLLEAGRAKRHPQNDGEATLAPMIDKHLGELDWKKSAGELHNLVRGLSGWPVAYTYLDGKLLKIHRAAVCELPSPGPGVVLEGERFLVGCGDGVLELREVQLEGKQRMEASLFLRGRRCAGKILGK